MGKLSMTPSQAQTVSNVRLLTVVLRQEELVLLGDQHLPHVLGQHQMY